MTTRVLDRQPLMKSARAILLTAAQEGGEKGAPLALDVRALDEVEGGQDGANVVQPPLDRDLRLLPLGRRLLADQVLCSLAQLDRPLQCTIHTLSDCASSKKHPTWNQSPTRQPFAL